MNNKNRNLSRSIGRAVWLPCSQTKYPLQIVWENKIYVAYEYMGRSVIVQIMCRKRYDYCVCMCLCVCVFLLHVWCVKVYVRIYESVRKKIEKMRRRENDRWTRYYNFRRKIAGNKIRKKKLRAKSAFGLLYYYHFFPAFCVPARG